MFKLRKLFLMLGVVAMMLTAATSGGALGQDMSNQVEVTSGQKLINGSLPFDKPITIKYSFATETVVHGVIMDNISKNEMKSYFSTINSNRDNWDGVYTRPGTNDSLNRFTFKATPSATGTDLFIYINPLKPNRFYDIRILRNPSGKELLDYFELFKIIFDKAIPYDTVAYLNDDGVTFRSSPGFSTFKSKIKQINEWKRPFEHYAFDGPDSDNDDSLNPDARLDVFHLIKFYVEYLRPRYQAWNAEGDATKKDALKKDLLTEISSFKRYNGDDQFWPDFTVGQSLRASSVSFNFDTRTGFNLTPDFGYLYYGFQRNFHGVAPYIGAQIEFRYFDKNIPFSLIAKKSIWHRLSFSTGITLTSLKKDKQREDFFSSKSLVAGLGFRLTSAVRMTSGVILFNRLDPNPLLDNKQLSVTPFAGISIDLKIKSLIGDASALFGLGSTNVK